MLINRTQTPETLGERKGEGLRVREGSLVTRLRRDQPRDLRFNMADEVERSRLMAEFSGVTDVDPERAQFYLESSGWDLHVSVLFLNLFESS